jgi:hypothetical protein
VLDVTRLRVLAAVARCGSVTALGYAQASVSHHIARLEAETGSQLVQRVGRGIRLTEAGRMLAQRAEDCIGKDATVCLMTVPGLAKCVQARLVCNIRGTAPRPKGIGR